MLKTKELNYGGDHRICGELTQNKLFFFPHFFFWVDWRPKYDEGTICLKRENNYPKPAVDEVNKEHFLFVCLKKKNKLTILENESMI